ncbi:hypothetical protein A8924_4733 [Saccharopolyspora erythraea NRRL 2338]|uniref:Uncharacterized protein n=2 Tax=Saccharopolyspora erythraea TaxID=1836 RepID=A4FHU0_SACEN|nr:hypothetical protein [Saccharopolyspora erythraea]EQD84278.1 hypothetical protein N599_20705 [Saccharopolyspora erythraea D]PFG97301.1 hypothetical protein A8924_4733 [Saccharopolyspora erythraea NRRL 2338]QRK87492.1 hypothetical protein JQX30_22135 [Saccharopolyspora erythraea]CAM03615.1 hypothetical protein SACE_4346 [Saccharopolyspora erythraea NRRL 2338]
MPEDDRSASVAELEAQSATAAKLFDVRTVIGGLFLVYGLLIGAAGLFPDEAGLAKSQGININLWTGLAMLVVGGLFVLWLLLRPLRHDTGGKETGSAENP